MNRFALFLGLCALLIAAVAFPAVAAKPRSGKWKGTTYANEDPPRKVSDTPTTFKVTGNGRRIRKFKAVAVVSCPAPYSTQIRNIIVPSLKVKKSGSFNRVYRVRDDDGSVLGTIHVWGKFRTKRRASGFIEIKEPLEDPLCQGITRFRAKKK